MDKYKTYLDIISDNSIIDIYTRDIGDHKKVKVNISGIFNIVLIDVGDIISFSDGSDIYSYTFTVIMV
jgi:hypothetical protein